MTSKEGEYYRKRPITPGITDEMPERRHMAFGKAGGRPGLQFKTGKDF